MLSEIPSVDNQVFFIINKKAGSGFQPQVEGQIIDACAKLGLESTLEFTQHKGHATELAREAVAAGFTRVFAMGGDGTVNEVAQGLVHTPAAMGIIPRGSGNGLARHLGIPLKIYGALGLLKSYKVIAIDTLRVNQRLSVNVSGVGFDAHIAAKFADHTRRGLLGYARIVLNEFFSYPDFDSKLTLDGVELRPSCFLLAIANSSQFGNNAKIAPHASVRDGIMDICFVQKVSWIHAAGFAMKMFTGRAHESRYIEIHQAKNLIAEFEQPLPFHIDGEPCPPTKRIEVEMEPGSLRVIVA